MWPRNREQQSSSSPKCSVFNTRTCSVVDHVNDWEKDADAYRPSVQYSAMCTTIDTRERISSVYGFSVNDKIRITFYV